MPRGWPLVVLIVVVLLLFAAPKIPQLARNLGQGMRIFRTEVKQMKSEDEAEQEESTKKKNPDEASDIRPVEGTVVDDEGSTGSSTQRKSSTGDTQNS